MEDNSIPVQLIVYCKNMKNPKVQRPRFDQTIKDGFWSLVKHKDAIQHENQSVTTTTEWSRNFQSQMSQKQIIKKTRNLIVRAAKYADILDLNFTISTANSPAETFSHQT